MTDLILPWPPATLSPNTRQHWAALAKAKKKYREACTWQIIGQGLKPIKAEKLHLKIIFVPPSRRAFDLDNCLSRLKSGLDALAHVIQVDDRHWALTISKSDEIGGFVRVQITDMPEIP